MQTPINDVVVDSNNWCVPGTENPLAGDAGHEEEPLGQIRRGLFANQQSKPSRQLGDFIVYDSHGEPLLSVQYPRSEVRAPLITALRDVLDTVDPIETPPNGE
jgi:hypothetical protein